MSKYLRVELVLTDLKHLMCIACGRLHPHVEYAIEVMGRQDHESQAGLHKSCIEFVHVKRGSNADAR